MKIDKIIATDIFNHICFTEMVASTDFNAVKNGDQLLVETGMDSFDFIIAYLNIGEIYGIEASLFEEEMENKENTLSDLLVFLKKHSTIEPSLKKVKEEYKRVEVNVPVGKKDSEKKSSKKKDSEKKSSKKKDSEKKSSKKKDSEKKSSKKKDSEKKSSKKKDSEKKSSKKKDSEKK